MLQGSHFNLYLFLLSFSLSFSVITQTSMAYERGYETAYESEDFFNSDNQFCHKILETSGASRSKSIACQYLISSLEHFSGSNQIQALFNTSNPLANRFCINVSTQKVKNSNLGTRNGKRPSNYYEFVHFAIHLDFRISDLVIGPGGVRANALLTTINEYFLAEYENNLLRSALENPARVIRYQDDLNRDDLYSEAPILSVNFYNERDIKKTCSASPNS